MKTLNLLFLFALFAFLPVSSIAWAQTGQVAGTVTNASTGEPLPGVNVVVEGTTQGTATNASGAYTITGVEAGTYSVRASFVGYGDEVEEGVVVNADDTTVVDFAMQPGALGLNEVVVVAYGTQQEEDLTGAVSSVSAADLQDQPVAQLTQALQGKVSGVEIKQTTGKPGEGINVQIRGAASLSAGTDPLYVVDGLPIVGGIDDIDPNTIESISVLKDAAATSLYGSRAANGVVLIETKKAVAGETRVDFSAYYGIEQIPSYEKPDMMNARQYARFQKEYAEFNGLPVDPAFQNPEQYGEGTDWYDVITRPAPIQDYSLTLRTGADQFSATATAGYLKQDGVVIGSGYERYSLRINTAFQPTDRLSIGLNLAPTYTVNRNTRTDGAEFGSGNRAQYGGGLIRTALLASPLASVRNSDGSPTLRVGDPATFPGPNPLNLAQDRVFEDEGTRILSNGFLEYEVIEGLNLKTQAGVDLGRSRANRFYPSTAGTLLFNPPPITPHGQVDNSNYLSWVSENTLRYQFEVGNHSLNALGGVTAQGFRAESSQIVGFNYPDDKVQAIDAAGQTTTSDNRTEWTLLSYLASVDYSYRDRYLLSASIRRDGSSRFGPDNRWGNFPSISAGWVVSEEEFMPDPDFLSLLKLRGSYGVVGNFNIGNYAHVSTIGATNYTFGGGLAPGRATNNLGDQNLGWETTRALDLGVDISFFDDRLQLTYDYYRKNITDLLFRVEVPQASGFSNTQTNIGELRIWGHEMSVKSSNIDTDDLTWNTDFNISFPRNEAVALGTQNAALFSGGTSFNRFFVTRVGQPIGQFYGFIKEGVYNDQAEFENSPKYETSQVGTVRMRDVNGDGVITIGGDRTAIGNPHPDFTFGMTNTVNYKNLDLSVAVTGSYGNDIYRRWESRGKNLDGVFNVLETVQDRWRSPENPGSGIVPSVAQGTTALDRIVPNTSTIYDGSYLAVKNITLGYTLPFWQSEGVRSLRVYGSVQRALMFTSYPGNPEVNTNPGNLTFGVDGTAYPVSRTFTLGVSLGL